MILQWRDSSFPPEQKVLGVIYDAGAILQTDLSELLGISIRMVQHYVRRMNREAETPLILKRLMRSALHRKEAKRFYTLSEEGAKYAHKMIGNPRNAKGVDALAFHQLGLIAILMRTIRISRPEDVHWYSTSEATDLLAATLLQENPAIGEDDLRSQLIRPDAALLFNGQLTWIEFDNNTEGARQLQIKYSQYNSLLQKVDPEERRVVWVAKSEERIRVMGAAWRGWIERIGEESTFADMHFFVEGQETTNLFRKREESTTEPGGTPAETVFR